MVRPNHNPITIAILGGDPMVGRTLELMLERAGYDARFLNGSFIEKPAAMPEEVGLVILSPGLHRKGRERFLRGRENGSGAATRVPVLELISAPERGRADQPGYVPWPCPVKDLELEIEAVLLAGSHACQQDATSCIVDIEPTIDRKVSIHFVAYKARTAPLLEDDRGLLPSIDSIIVKTAIGTKISRVKTLLGDAGSPGAIQPLRPWQEQHGLRSRRMGDNNEQYSAAIARSEATAKDNGHTVDVQYHVSEELHASLCVICGAMVQVTRPGQEKRWRVGGAALEQECLGEDRSLESGAYSGLQ